MKTLILLTLSLISLSVLGQSITTNGSVTAVERRRGGMIMDTLLIIPVRLASHPAGYTNTTTRGEIIIDKSDSVMKYGMGGSFIALLPATKAAQLYFPKPTGTGGQYLDGTGAPTTFPSTVPPGRTITIDFNGTPIAYDLSADRTFTITEGDASPTNEGGLTVGTGSATTSIISSNTFSSNSVTLSAGSGISLNESGNTIEIESPNQTVTLTGDITGNGTTSVSTSIANNAVTDSKIASVAPGKITQSGATTNQVLKWNGSAWVPANDATGGSGTVTSVTSADANASVSNQSTTPVITVNSAPKLQTARNINGQSFDGTANITIPGSAIASIPNSSLSNSSITVNGQAISLGSTATITASPNVGSPSAGNSVTMGTAFQPRSGGPCHIVVNGSLSGIVGLLETITVATSSTQNGTYTNVTSDILLVSVLGQTVDRSIASFPVKAGDWVKVTRSGSAATATYTKIDL